MKKRFTLTAFGSLFLLGAANHVLAASLPIHINGVECGEYTSAVFDGQGRLQLNAELTCLSADGNTGGDDNTGNTGDGNTGNTGDGNTGNTGDGNTGNTGDGNTGGDDFPVSGKIVSIHNNDWTKPIASNVYAPIALTPDEVFSYKINKPSGASGYGYFGTISTTRVDGMRTIVVSKAAGSMTPVHENCELVGTENRLEWSFSDSKPRGSTMCRLNPNEQYYVNVKHLDRAGKNSCTSNLCYFTYDFRLQRTY